MNKKTLRDSKRILTCFIVFMLCIQMIQNFVPMNIVFADDIVVDDFPFITNISLAGEDGNAYDLSTKVFGKNSKLRIYYKFNISTDQQIENGKEYKITIPEEFTVNSAEIVSLNAKDKDGNTVATTGSAVSTSASVTTDSDVTTESGSEADLDTDIIGIAATSGSNNITIKFNQEKDENLQLSGEFYVDASFNPEEIGAATTKTIAFAENGTTIQGLTVNFDNEITFPFITGVYLSDEKFQGDLDFENENFEDNYKKYFDEHLSTSELEKDA